MKTKMLITGLFLNIVKCIALGGMAGQFLKAAAVSTEKAIEMTNLTKRQIEVIMFAAGVGNIGDLDSKVIHE